MPNKNFSEALVKFVEPIKVRWVYHFICAPKTSAIDKPEWYLNQTIKLIYQNIDNAEKELGSQAKSEFILCMVECVAKRLERDLKEIADGLLNEDTEIKYEVILIHTYNEVISFVKVLKQLLGYDKYLNLDDKYDLMAMFADQTIFERIIEVEWEHADKLFEEILDMPNPWNYVLAEEYRDDYKIPRCVDKFLMLIATISDRIECFRQEDCQFKLVELQLNLTDRLLKYLKESAKTHTSALAFGNILKFPNALLSLHSSEQMPESSKLIAIQNGANFLRLVLKGNHIIPQALSMNLDFHLRDRLRALANQCTVG